MEYQKEMESYVMLSRAQKTASGPACDPWVVLRNVFLKVCYIYFAYSIHRFFTI